MQRIASRGSLNSPWGLAIAPSSFGEFSDDLLVGNFGDGTINVFSRTDSVPSASWIGRMASRHATDLWALQANGDNILFTAGLANESHGLFGSLSATSSPNPSTATLTREPSGWGSHSGVAMGAGHFNW